ncbi:MAG TPA: hypothetical protein VFC13_01745 [Actinomycetes bacterium]|nr:hypothetical protein [Actinomycetes bacterium]
MPPSTCHPASAARLHHAWSVRRLLAVVLLGLGWLLAWAPAAGNPAPRDAG